MLATLRSPRLSWPEAPSDPDMGSTSYAEESGFAHPGEADEDIWQRAVVAVHEFCADRQPDPQSRGMSSQT